MVGMVERQMGVGTICMAAFGAFRRSVAWAVLGVLLGVLAPPALAQFGMMNDGDAMAMAIGRESAERYAELMGLRPGPA
ncbi:MAG: hypothetical protein KatS3mg103_0907 [Phycisphaerales bacterium]|nr:MAG: hypothetical protein KatS3mg103_0907 [Phycisphaerales bacterium]